MHTFYRRCNGKASCNCAVAVQSGNDVIVIDKCGPKAGTKKALTIKVYRKDKLNPGTKIIQSAGGKQYEVKKIQ